MAKFTKLATIDLPEFNVHYAQGTYSFSDSNTKSKNIEVLKTIKTKFYDYIKKWGDIFEVDPSVIIGFIAVESMGKEGLAPNSAGATGLGQVTVVSVIETVSKFNIITKKELPSEAKTYMQKKAPFLLKLTPNNQSLSSSEKSKLLSLLQNDNEFNILMSIISLRWLFEFLKYDNKAWLNRSIIGYNQSAYGRIRTYKGKPVTTDQLFKDKVIPKETRNYLAKLLGRDGFMQLIIENKIY